MTWLDGCVYGGVGRVCAAAGQGQLVVPLPRAASGWRPRRSCGDGASEHSRRARRTPHDGGAAAKDATTAAWGVGFVNSDTSKPL